MVKEMMPPNINNKVVSATKWSAITEIAAKLVSPISTMVLARLLTPEAFGVLVTATMVISFAEIFTDAGFQKYIIQHKFKNDEELYKSTAVAFWSNLIFSLIVWSGISLFANEIAHLVGNDGYGVVIAISCICIPLEAFSSIQMALFKRKMDFKTLFVVRIIGIAVPLVVTIPLAFMTHSYWSLIIGMIALNICNAVLLTVKSSWKPHWFYNFELFRDMFSFTVWSMFEAISIWLTGYMDVFIVGTMFNTYYMGIYRTSISLVGSIMALITSSTTPVLFSALSKLQDNDDGFKKMFFKFQKLVGIVVMPLGVGLFLFRDIVTNFLLGSQWTEASYFVGWMGLTSALMIVFSHYCSELFRAKGKPQYSVMSQMIHLSIMVPTVYISAKYGFEMLCLSRALVRLTGIISAFAFLYMIVHITPLDMVSNMVHPIFATTVMFFLYKLLPMTDSMVVSIIYAILCALIYTITICMFREERNILRNIKTMFNK